MATFYHVKADDIPKNYDANGFAKSELLPGSYAGGMRNYKCFLKAGCEVSPELYADQTVLLFFGKGKGYITSEGEMNRITDAAVYAPNFDKVPYTIHAVEELEFVMSVVEMNQWDKELFVANHVRVPFFTLIKDAIIYDQDCKGPNTTSYSILGAKQLGRIMVGAVQAVGEGTVEKGHPTVEQWNYCLGDSDFKLIVDNGDPVPHKAGDWSYVPAGYDHSLIADPGKEVYYIWYEHYVREKDFAITMAPGDQVKA